MNSPPHPIVRFFDPPKSVITYPDLSGTITGLMVRDATPDEVAAYRLARVVSSFWQAITPPPWLSWVDYTGRAMAASQALSEFWQSVQGVEPTIWLAGGWR